jgi:hypothetical protein
MKRVPVAIPAATSPHEFLLQLGTDKFVHSERTLYEHLCGVESVLSAWHQPQEMRNAGLFHSIYSTETFRHAALPITERRQLQLLIGEKAERLVYLFCCLRRKELFDSCSSLSSRAHFDLPVWNGGPVLRVSVDEVIQVVLLHMANRIEQATKPVTGIGFWLSFVSDRARTLRGSAKLPKVLTTLETITLDDERRLHSLYLQGIRFLQNDEPRQALPCLERACADYGFVGEPYLMLAVAQRAIGDLSSARRSASRGLELLKVWGVPWHKRLSRDGWHKLAESVAGKAPIEDIKDILGGMVGAKNRESAIAMRHRGIGSEAVDSLIASSPADVSRFFLYLSTVRAQRSKDAMNWYPGLRRTSWHDAAQFAAARELEARSAEIKAEAIKIQPAYYHEETEQIGRTGNWQVCMFYEQGRRNDVVCNQCPTIVSIIEKHPTIRRTAGLIYLSRMAPHTYIAPHQGGTNIRLRCHLAISIPGGDCAMRVGDEVRSWQEGKCLIFDDTFEHEVWNRTDQDRLVLLVDFWHSDLSQLEREALDAINWLGITRANGMLSTWQRNDTQRRKEGKLRAG